MLALYKNGITSVILRIKILDSTAAFPKGLTGLTSSSSGLIISTIANNEATATAYTVAGSTIESITTLGTYAAPTATKCRFKEVDATNHPGVYEIQIADARFAVANARSVIVSILGATNAAQTDALLQLTNAGLEITVDTQKWLGGVIPAPNITGVPIIDVENWDGVAIAEPATDGVPDVNIKNIVNVAATLDANNVLNVSTKYIGGTLQTAGDFARTVALTESYSALHAAPTEAQLLFEIRSLLQEKAVVSTTLTAKKVDGSTAAMTFTLNDATAPTTITRAS